MAIIKIKSFGDDDEVQKLVDAVHDLATLHNAAFLQYRGEEISDGAKWYVFNPLA